MMQIALNWLLSKISSLLGTLTVYFKGQYDGRQQEKLKQAENALECVKKTKKIKAQEKRRIQALSEAELDAEVYRD